MKLYFSRGTCALAVHIALYETGLTFTTEAVDIRKKTTASGGDFRQVNPNGYVPVLELDDGERLTEVTAVLQYVADQRPAAGLAPAAGTREHYRLLQWLGFVSSELHKGYSPLFAPTTPEAYKVIVKERLAQRLGYVNGRLHDRPYLLGEGFSIADAYLFVIVGWSQHVGVDLSPHPQVQAFHARVSQRPAVQQAMQAEIPAQ
jgi:glutathione S-transferase